MDFVITVPIVDIPDPLPAQAVEMPWSGAGTLRAYLYTGADLSQWPGSVVELGRWDETTGEPLEAIGGDYWSFVARLGNNNRRATGPHDTLRWQGHSQEKWETYDAVTPANNRRYPTTQDPFVLTVEHLELIYPDWDSGTTYALGDKVMHLGQGYQSQQNGNIGHEPGAAGSGPWWATTEFGYGFRATMIEPAASQDPITNYNVREYPDEDCTPGTQLYTSGNFADVGGGVFQTETPSGNLAPTKHDVHLALIFVGGGNSQNGILTLPVGQGSVTREFWATDSV